MKVIWIISAVLVAGYVGICLWLYLAQAGFVYVPRHELEGTPADLGLDYRDVTLTTGDGIHLNAWWVPGETDGPTVLLCHGNGGNISYRLQTLAQLNRMGAGVLIFDYRGYGLSEGTPSEEGTYRDAEAAWDYLTGPLGRTPEKVVIFGRSLGGAVASHLALKVKPAALIIESSFTSIPDMGARSYPWLPVRLLSRFHYSTLENLRRAPCPVMIIHGREDEMIPYEMGRRLFEAAPEPKQFLEIRGGHNGGHLETEGYEETLARYLKQMVQA